MIERALLFTDVVDSTQMTERLGDARTAALWTEHDRRARDLLVLHHGLEIGRGDGLLLLFDTAPDAVCYALDYQLLMAELGLRARCGLHYGRVLLRENLADEVAHGARRIDVQGLTVSVAARVMALASGGKTLLTAAARLALGDALPEEAEVRSHGHYRLKGVETPVEILEMGRRESVLFEPPGDTEKAYRVSRVGDLWLPVREVRQNLPAERNAFVGRVAELGELQRRFSEGARLVSIAGIGGTGKTRLARRYGWTALGDFRGGVWFCDLSQARTLDGIAFAVARSLDVPLADGDPVEQLALALRARGRCLLILDNFELVVEHAEATVGHWLDQVVEASYLVTTREVLRVPGEVVLHLQPLPPADGVALFVKRAAAASGRQPTPADQDAAVLKLVEVLDGLPLAIELAAARARVMSARAMVERMHERFKLLSSPARSRGRHATLRATFDWSWDLLSASERSALAELSVFEGGFTLEAAQAVIDASGGQAGASTLDLIQSLVEKSLLRRTTERRFDMLASLQDYADEHLRTPGRFAGSGDAALAAAQARHWRYFAALAEAQVIADRCADADNLAVACRRAVAREDADGAAGTLLGAWAVLALRGPYRAAVELADAVLQIPGIGPADRARAEFVKGSALFMLGRADDAHACVEAGLRIVASTDKEIEARLLCVRGELLTKAGRYPEAAVDLQRALTLARSTGPESVQCKALNALIVLAVERGNLPEARNYCEAGLRIARAARDERWEGGILGNMAFIDYSEGKAGDAVKRYLQALELAKETGDRRWEGNARCNVGLLLHEQKQSAEARNQLEAALEIARSIGHARLECTVLCNLGIVLEALGLADAACVHYEESVRLAQELRDARTEGQFRAHLGTCYARRGDFGKARSCLDAGESLLGAIGDRLNLALLLCAGSEVENLAGNREGARAQLARSEALASAAGAGAQSELGQRLLTVRRLLAESDRSPAAPVTD